MNILSICVAAVLTSLLAVFLRRHNAEYSLILTLCGVTLIILTIIGELVFALDAVRKIVDNASVNIIYVEILLKCVGICFITEFTSDCCKDASQNALSSIVLMTGRIFTLLTAFPMFEEFLGFTMKLSGGKI